MKPHIILLLIVVSLTFAINATEDNNLSVSIQNLIDYVNAIDPNQHHTIVYQSDQYTTLDDRAKREQIGILRNKINCNQKDAAQTIISYLEKSQYKWESYWLLEVLADTKDEYALKVFEKYIHNDDEDLRIKALYGLSHFGHPALEILYKYIDDPNVPNRFRALQSVNDIAESLQKKNNEILEEIINSTLYLLKDKDAMVRYFALHFISLGDNSYSPLLARGLDDEKNNGETMVFMEKRNDPNAIPYLMGYLLNNQEQRSLDKQLISRVIGNITKLELPPLEIRYRTRNGPGPEYYVSQDRQISYIINWWNNKGRENYKNYLLSETKVVQKDIDNRDDYAIKAAQSWFMSLMRGNTDLTTALSDVPFSFDLKENVVSLTELKILYDKIIEQKGKRDLKPTSIKIETSSSEKVELILTIEDEKVIVYVTPGIIYQVTGFTD